jgi:1A family penicillin-binding protein
MWRKARKLIVVCTILGGAFFFMGGGMFLLWASTLTLPTVDIVEAQRRQQSTKIFDRTGEVLLYNMNQDLRRTVVPLEEMSQHIKHATIAIEDAGFYGHFGVEPLAIVRAAVRNLQAGDLLGGQGGSTITQQVVKNMLLVSDKKLSRKLKEWVLAIKLERELTKDEILELYLNEVPYGGTRYGVEEASQGFFGKHASDISILESAYIAALPQAPTYFSPYGNNRSALDARARTVLLRMFEQGYITKEEYEEALEEEVEFRAFTTGSIKAPHFVFYVINELQRMYETVDIAQANLHIITTLDWELQMEAERIVYEKAMQNATNFNASNASLMAIDPRSGGIMVMVGSRDYFDEEIDGNFNIGLALRQPGSAFKPFAYAAALEKGYTTETIVYDTRTQFSTSAECPEYNLTSEGGCYSPGNYDDIFRGPVTFRQALAQSVNVPAVKAMYLAGLEETHDLARRMGISTLQDYRRYGLTLVLGGGEVSLLDITSAYATFARSGWRHPYNGIQEVRDGTGTVVFERQVTGRQVIQQEIAHAITDILADNVARTPAFGANSYLHFPGRAVAAKTGTTNNYVDAWIVGYTPTIAVGAWAGNNDNSSMERRVAGFIIAPMWNEFMQEYFKRNPDSYEFPKPPPIDPELKPILRGVIPTTQPTLSATGTILTLVSQPIHRSILHWVDRSDPRGPEPSNPARDPQYQRWEYGVTLWRLTQGGGLVSDRSVVDEDVFDGEPLTVSITRPRSGDTFRMSDIVDVRIRTERGQTIREIQYYLNDSLVYTAPSETSTYSFMPGEMALTEGTHTLMVIAYGEEGQRGGTSVDITVTTE